MGVGRRQILTEERGKFSNNWSCLETEWQQQWAACQRQCSSQEQKLEPSWPISVTPILQRSLGYIVSKDPFMINNFCFQASPWLFPRNPGIGYCFAHEGPWGFLDHQCQSSHLQSCPEGGVQEETLAANKQPQSLSFHCWNFILWGLAYSQDSLGEAFFFSVCWDFASRCMLFGSNKLINS